MKKHWLLYLIFASLLLFVFAGFAIKYEPAFLYYILVTIFFLGLIEPIIIEYLRLNMNMKILWVLGAEDLDKIERYEYARLKHNNIDFNVSSKTSRWNHSNGMNRALLFTMKSKNTRHIKISNINTLQMNVQDKAIEQRLAGSGILDDKKWAMEFDIYHTILYTNEKDAGKIRKYLDAMIELSKKEALKVIPATKKVSITKKARK
jgi:hypothetical protein